MGEDLAGVHGTAAVVPVEVAAPVAPVDKTSRFARALFEAVPPSLETQIVSHGVLLSSPALQVSFQKIAWQPTDNEKTALLLPQVGLISLDKLLQELASQGAHKPHGVKIGLHYFSKEKLLRLIDKKQSEGSILPTVRQEIEEKLTSTSTRGKKIAKAVAKVTLIALALLIAAPFLASYFGVKAARYQWKKWRLGMTILANREIADGRVKEFLEGLKTRKETLAEQQKAAPATVKEAFTRWAEARRLSSAKKEGRRRTASNNFLKMALKRGKFEDAKAIIEHRLFRSLSTETVRYLLYTSGCPVDKQVELLEALYRHSTGSKYELMTKVRVIEALRLLGANEKAGELMKQDHPVLAAKGTVEQLEALLAHGKPQPGSALYCHFVQGAAMSNNPEILAQCLPANPEDFKHFSQALASMDAFGNPPLLYLSKETANQLDQLAGLDPEKKGSLSNALLFYRLLNRRASNTAYATGLVVAKILANAGIVGAAVVTHGTMGVPQIIAQLGIHSHIGQVMVNTFVMGGAEGVVPYLFLGASTGLIYKLNRPFRRFQAFCKGLTPEISLDAKVASPEEQQEKQRLRDAVGSEPLASLLPEVLKGQDPMLIAGALAREGIPQEKRQKLVALLLKCKDPVALQQASKSIKESDLTEGVGGNRRKFLNQIALLDAAGWQKIEGAWKGLAPLKPWDERLKVALKRRQFAVVESLLQEGGKTEWKVSQKVIEAIDEAAYLPDQLAQKLFEQLLIKSDTTLDEKMPAVHLLQLAEACHARGVFRANGHPFAEFEMSPAQVQERRQHREPTPTPSLGAINGWLREVRNNSNRDQAQRLAAAAFMLKTRLNPSDYAEAFPPLTAEQLQSLGVEQAEQDAILADPKKAASYQKIIYLDQLQLTEEDLFTPIGHQEEALLHYAAQSGDALLIDFLATKMQDALGDSTMFHYTPSKSRLGRTYLIDSVLNLPDKHHHTIASYMPLPTAQELDLLYGHDASNPASFTQAVREAQARREVAIGAEGTLVVPAKVGINLLLDPQSVTVVNATGAIAIAHGCTPLEAGAMQTVVNASLGALVLSLGFAFAFFVGGPLGRVAHRAYQKYVAREFQKLPSTTQIALGVFKRPFLSKEAALQGFNRLKETGVIKKIQDALDKKVDEKFPEAKEKEANHTLKAGIEELAQATDPVVFDARLRRLLKVLIFFPHERQEWINSIGEALAIANMRASQEILASRGDAV